MSVKLEFVCRVVEYFWKGPALTAKVIFSNKKSSKKILQNLFRNILNVFSGSRWVDQYDLEEKKSKCTLCPRQFSKQGILKNYMMGEHNIGI